MYNDSIQAAFDNENSFTLKLSTIACIIYKITKTL